VEFFAVNDLESPIVNVEAEEAIKEKSPKEDLTGSTTSDKKQVGRVWLIVDDNYRVFCRLTRKTMCKGRHHVTKAKRPRPPSSPQSSRVRRLRCTNPRHRLSPFSFRICRRPRLRRSPPQQHRPILVQFIRMKSNRETKLR
jgi:hypothetical protein